MKKSIFSIGLLLAIAVPWLPSPALATDPLYQGCTVNSLDGFVMSGPSGDSWGTEQYQTFTATSIDTLTKFMAVVSHTAIADIALTLFKQGTSEPLYYKEFSLTTLNPDASPRLFYAMSDDNLNIPLEIGANYSIGVYTGGYTLKWPYSENSNCDPYGSASFRVAQGDPEQPQVKDFWYNVWGTKTTTSTPVVTSTPAVISSDSGSQSGAAPAATTTASIKAPTSVKAENVAGAAVPTVKLTWTKSTTTDITGYKIFRSTEEKTGFKEIGKVDKAIVEFTDTTGLASTKHFYFVRANKDASESASSATVNVTTEAAPVAEATPAVAETTTEPVAAETVAPVTQEDNTDWILIIAIIALVLLAGAVAYFELKAKKDGKKVSRKILYPLIGVMVVAAGLIVWRVLPANEGTAQKTEEKEVVVAPKHADWPVFDSAKNGFKLYHPAEYTVTEGAGGNVSINKGADIVGEVYFYNNDGDEAGMMKSSGALYMDGSKGYMTGGVESTTTATTEKISAKKYTGTFGKNAGAKVMVHDGIKGSVIMFSKNDKTWQIFSFDNGDAAAQVIFDDMITDLKF